MMNIRKRMKNFQKDNWKYENLNRKISNLKKTRKRWENEKEEDNLLKNPKKSLLQIKWNVLLFPISR